MKIYVIAFAIPPIKSAFSYIIAVKGLLRAIEIESENIQYQLAFDNVYDVHSLDKIKLYLDAVTTKMTKTDEILTEDDLF